MKTENDINYKIVGSNKSHDLDEYLSSQLSYYENKEPYILKCDCGNTHIYSNKYTLYRAVKTKSCKNRPKSKIQREKIRKSK